MSCSRICSCVADTPLAVKLNCVKRLNYATALTPSTPFNSVNGLQRPSTALRREGVGASFAELC